MLHNDENRHEALFDIVNADYVILIQTGDDLSLITKISQEIRIHDQIVAHHFYGHRHV